VKICFNSFKRLKPYFVKKLKDFNTYTTDTMLKSQKSMWPSTL
jgi:hypothetical protein